MVMSVLSRSLQGLMYDNYYYIIFLQDREFLLVNLVLSLCGTGNCSQTKYPNMIYPVRK